jgi:hypothetical protein
MPVLQTTAYNIVEDILLDARAICNDMAIPGGDVLTDDAPFSMQFVNQAYRRIQAYLAQYGVETYQTYQWLLAIPANTTGDPESRVWISDSGCQIVTPSGAGESSFAEPILPDDLVYPVRCRERQNGTTDFAQMMFRPNDGVRNYYAVATYLVMWEWINETLTLRGATQVQDLELKYEKHLPILSLVTDTVPIRGVDNAAAYRVAYAFAKSRGAMMADSFGQEGQAEMDLVINRSLRERQRIKHRRRPYSHRGGGRGMGTRL